MMSEVITQGCDGNHILRKGGFVIILKRFPKQITAADVAEQGQTVHVAFMPEKILEARFSLPCNGNSPNLFRETIRDIHIEKNTPRQAAGNDLKGKAGGKNRGIVKEGNRRRKGRKGNSYGGQAIHGGLHGAGHGSAVEDIKSGVLTPVDS